MSKWQTFLQNLFPLAKGIRGNLRGRKGRRAMALIITALVFSAVNVSPLGFVNEGQALAAYGKASWDEEEWSEDGQLAVSAGSEEKEWFTLRKMQTVFAAARKQIGEMLEMEKDETTSLTSFVSSHHSRYSDKDYQALLHIVQAEAGGCDNTGKILVANVILNRVKSEGFPNTITDVVYQKSQFSPVADGSIHQVEVSESTKNCVDRALDGEDYSQGALYFMNRNASQGGNVSWFDRELTFILKHGPHEFFK